MVQTPGPGSCGAGSDPDQEIGEGYITTPERAGEITGDQDGWELPSLRAVLVIILRQVSAVDRHTER